MEKWDRKSWLWVLVCVAAILYTVPLARGLQRLVYSTAGKEFFTYTVFIAVCACLAAVLYFLFFKYQVKSAAQYAWLFLSAGAYIYYTIHLRESPEEAVHLVEYGLLSCFFFRALSAKIHDRTIYITVLFFVSFVGALDEFIQWMMPGRYWGFNDVWINMLASLIFVVAVSKGIRPAVICEPANGFSLKILAGIVTVNLLFFGLCLSNTPDTVKRYTSVFEGLSWLRSEEPMTEFGYKHRDPPIGTFYSRMTLEELKEIDLEKGEANGKALKFNAVVDEETCELKNSYTPYTDRFLYEFLKHVIRRDENVEEAKKADEVEDQDKKNRLNSGAYTEHLLLEKYFGVTLKHSGLGWSDEKVKEMEEKASLWNKDHISNMDQIITFIDLKMVWAVITVLLAVIWVPQLFHKIRPD